VTHFVDITTQPVFTGGRFEMIDLDLDLLVTAEGSVLIEDEDEFALHQVALGYSPGMISRASSELREIEALLRTRAEPFFEVAADWLEVASRQLSGRGPV
jgi:predicted RNA-binding protein associated with RNAse of E/G family